MKRNLCKLIILFIPCLFLFTTVCQAKYSENLLNVTNQKFTDVGLVKTIVDEDGKTYIAWQQVEINGAAEAKVSIYLQLLDKTGEFLWDENGLFIADVKGLSSNFNEDLNLSIASDGNLILSHIFLQDSNDVKGFTIYKISPYKQIIWKKTQNDVFINLSAFGIMQFHVTTSEDNIIICTTTSNQSYIQILSNEGERKLVQDIEIDACVYNPIIVPCIDNSFACVYRLSKTLFVDKYTTTGEVIWKAVYVGNETADNLNIENTTYVFSDNDGGIIITWEFDGKIYVQRIDSNGNRLFSNDGINISVGDSDIHHVADVDVKNKIIHISWVSSLLNKKTIVLQRLDFNGKKLYNDNGLVLKKLNDFVDNKPIAIVHIPNKRVLVFIKYKEDPKDIFSKMIAIRADENETIFWEKQLYSPLSNFYSTAATKFFNDQVVLTWCDEDVYVNTTFNKTIKAVCISYNGIIGVDESSIVNLASVFSFPNPTNNNLNLIINNENNYQHLKIKIVDINGIIVYTDDIYINMGRNVIPLNVNNLLIGSYIISVYSEDNTLLNKLQIIKE